MQGPVFETGAIPDAEVMNYIASSFAESILTRAYLSIRQRGGVYGDGVNWFQMSATGNSTINISTGMGMTSAGELLNMNDLPQPPHPTQAQLQVTIQTSPKGATWYVYLQYYQYSMPNTGLPIFSGGVSDYPTETYDEVTAGAVSSLASVPSNAVIIGTVTTDNTNGYIISSTITQLETKFQTPHAVAASADQPTTVTQDTGTSTSVGAGSLTDTTKSWTVNAYAGYVLIDSTGTWFYITSNSATVLTLMGTNIPASGAYTITIRTGIAIKRVSPGTPYGTMTIQWTYAAKTLTYTAPGDTAGASVSVSSGSASIVLTSNNGSLIEVLIDRGNLPGKNLTITTNYYDIYSRITKGYVQPFSVEDLLHRDSMGSGASGVSSDKNVHGLALRDLIQILMNEAVAVPPIEVLADATEIGTSDKYQFKSGSGASGFFRVIDISGATYLTKNCRYDGSNWHLDLSTIPGISVKMDAVNSLVTVYYAVASVDPISFVQMFVLNMASTATILSLNDQTGAAHTVQLSKDSGTGQVTWQYD